MRRRLQSKNVKFRESVVRRTGDTKFFLYDPDGVGVELNFPQGRQKSARQLLLRSFPPISDKVIRRPYLGREAVKLLQISDDHLGLAAAAAG